MCRLRNIALESVTEKCDRRTEDRRTDKVIPMCCYALQATQYINVQRTNVIAPASLFVNKNSGSIPRNACVACKT